MEALFGPIMLVGKYVFLGLVYAFLYWAFRGLFAQTAQEAVVPRALAPSRPPVVPAPAVAAPAVAAPVLVPPAPVAAPPPAAALLAAEEPPALPADPALEEPPLPGPLPAPVPLPRPALIVQEPGKSGLEAGQVIELTAAITIGRAEDNGLVVNDKFCSTHHAMIYLQRGQRQLRDRGSTNGTYHNGQLISDDVLLVDGDRIGIGTVVFSYRAGND